MITTALIYLAGILMQSLLLIMYPFRGSNGFPSSVDSAITSAASYVHYADSFIPLSTVSTVITFVIAFEITVMTFYVLRWLVGYLPVVGGR
jgi:uncharacterized membrane protein